MISYEVALINSYFIRAANNLNIPGLVDICCRTVAAKLKGKEPAQIREEFGIEDDFSPEERAEVSINL